jgi:hypothetical protein
MESSKGAQWFVMNLQVIQDEFAGSVGGQIITTNKNGNLVTKMSKR